MNPMIKLLPEYATKQFNDIYDNEDDFLNDYQSVGIPATIKIDNARTLFYLLYAKYGNNPIANYDETQWKYKLFSIIFMYGPTWEKRLEVQDKLRNFSEAQLKTGAIRNYLSRQDITGNSRTTNDGSNGQTTTNNLTENTQSTGTQNTTATGSSLDNHAFNPSTNPSTDTTIPLNYIDQQNYKKDDTTGTQTNQGTGVKTNTGSSTISGTNTSTAQNNNSSTSNGATDDTTTIGTLSAYAQLLELLDTDVTNDFLAKFINLFKKFARPARTWIYETEVDYE